MPTLTESFESRVDSLLAANGLKTENRAVFLASVSSAYGLDVPDDASLLRRCVQAGAVPATPAVDPNYGTVRERAFQDYLRGLGGEAFDKLPAVRRLQLHNDFLASANRTSNTPTPVKLQGVREKMTMTPALRAIQDPSQRSFAIAALQEAATLRGSERSIDVARLAHLRSRWGDLIPG